MFLREQLYEHHKASRQRIQQLLSQALCVCRVALNELKKLLDVIKLTPEHHFE